jgi:hypothetical protein
MDLKQKIINTLRESLNAEYVLLEDDDGISGFVVSRTFREMSTLDRQEKIEESLQNASLAQDERRRVLMIAGLTPEEYDAVGVRIRVKSVTERAKGELEIVLRGGWSDAEYVRGALNNQKGVRTTEPKPVSGALGELMSFRARGTDANPLTKERAVRVLKKDQYIEVLSDA